MEKEIDGMNVSATEKEEAKIKAVMRMRDGILKSYIAHGFPKVEMKHWVSDSCLMI